MEREKTKLQLKRSGSKVKALHVPDFIALGSKSSRAQTDNTEPKAKAKSPILSTAASERKDLPSNVASSSALSTKRLKVSTTANPSLSRPSTQVKKESKCSQWDQIAIEVDAGDFVSRVLDAEDVSDDERVESLLCGAVKKLKNTRAKPEPLFYLGLQFLAKTRPFLFCSELVIEALSSLLKRDITVNFKTKGNNLVSVLSANILMAAYRDESNWPELFAKVYIEDSLGERVWVDHDYCKCFVDNILTAFNTKPIPKSLLAPDRIFKPEACPSPPNPLTDDEEASCSSMNLEFQESQESIPIFPRFHHSEESLAQHVLEVIREQMSRRQPTEISRNTLRFLVSTCGLSEVRLTVSQKLEMWLQNPKLTRPAQELLLSVCLNCNQHNQHDIEVISQLVKTRIKAKPIINYYLMCMKELLSQHPDNLSTLLKHAIYNELSNSRNPNNMPLIAIIFQHSPDKAAKMLANVFLDLLLNKDDYLRALRALLREIVRTVRHELNFSMFCLELLQERKDAAFTDLEGPMKERVFHSIADLIVLSIFLSVSPTVKEQYSAYTRGERKDFTQLRNYQLQVAAIERDAIWWLHTIVPKVFKPARNELIHCIHKILFMEQIEHYHNKDNWPTEGERMLLLRLASEVPLLEDTLMRVMVIGLSRDHPLTALDAIELADQLVKRAAAIYNEDFPVLEFENPELCDAIFNLCAYHYPENISLPQGYHPPNLAISELYWKAWMMLLIIVSHNPSTFGEMAWKTYPMLRNMMEMCITNQFIFPPPTLAMGEKAEEMKNRELQMYQMEKDRILLFETHLAAASTKVAITQTNSLLLSKLISMDPHGPPRKPPMQVMEQLKALNAKLKLGELLCHSRNPDFLLDIIQRQGTSQSMPWLSELVESSAGSFNMLPVQCLCEFLINEMGQPYISADVMEENREENKERAFVKKKKKQEQLLFHLQKLLHEPESDENDTIEIITYFMKRLRSQQASARSLAGKGLQMVLSQPNKSPESDDVEMMDQSCGDYDWLLKIIPSLPHFHAVRSQINLFLRHACQIENDPATIAAYVTFLATNTPDHDLQDFADLALDMAQMIVERPTIVNTILPSEGARNGHSNDFLSSISEIFFKYLNAAKGPSKEVYSWSESQDQIIIQWPNGEAATMHILVVHAMIIVLTYGPPQTNSRVCFEKLLDSWFPRDSEPPKAFLVDTSEEALLLPDWLKLRMIRSSVDVLVDAALKDLDPSQLVLFIQSFGIPVSSMSKLLKTLDVAVEFDSYAVKQAVLDKSYMSQLVEVQHIRGACGGEKFAKLLIDHTCPDVTMESPSVPLQTRVIQRAPPKLPTAIDVDSVSISILKLFGMDTSGGILSAKQEHDLFMGLKKALSQDILNKNTEGGAVTKFINTFEQILSSDLKTVFFQSLCRKTSYSSVLLRFITIAYTNCDVAKSGPGTKLVNICHRIMVMGAEVKSPLVHVATQFFEKHRTPAAKKSAVWKNVVKMNKIKPKSCRNVMEIVQIAAKHDPLRLEEVIQYLVKYTILAGNTGPLMSAMTNITLQRLYHPSLSTPLSFYNRSKFCFFVDWLECLEPNLVTSFHDSQCQLLFSLLLKEGKPMVIPFRPYLLALLIHQSSWDTLHFYINMLLGPKVVNTTFDPSSVLDFLHACIDIPKIWQGKYKKKCKRGMEEDVLALSKAQIQAVVSYILEETLLKQQLDDKIMECDSHHNESLPTNTIMETRLHLLMKCLSNRKYLVYHAVKYLVQIISTGDPKSKLATELLFHMYLHIPSLLVFVPEIINLSKCSETAKAHHSSMDVITHTLLISLSRTDNSKHCIERMSDIDFMCRKIASAHPILLLRQLPMIFTLLRGRVHFEFNIFRTRNHMALFSCILGILEILPPLLYEAEYLQEFHSILDLYIEVIQTYSGHKELIPLMNLVFGFLLAYLHAKPSTARPYIAKYSEALHDLSSTYPDYPSLRLLLASACMNYWGGPNIQSSDAKTDTNTTDAFAPLPVPLPCSVPQIGSIVNRLNHGSAEEISTALKELDTVSSRKAAVMEPVLDKLRAFMQNGNPSVCMHAFNLMMRYVKNYPKRGSYFVSTYLQCLESDQRDIINLALEHLPEFVILVQEHAGVLLQKAFSISMLLNINAGSQIRETISLLTMQSGC